MAKYRKLSRTSSQRKALLRNQVTQLLYHGRIVTTAAKAEEVQKIAEKMITIAKKEMNNYDEVTVQAKVPQKDAKGKRVKEVTADGKKVTVYDTVEKTIKKDQPSRLHARRQMLETLYSVTEKGAKKSETKTIDMANYMFDEVAPKYAERNGGYTRIIKLGQRKGDGALEVIIELV